MAPDKRIILTPQKDEKLKQWKIIRTNISFISLLGSTSVFKYYYDFRLHDYATTQT
jgi:hypothetical protein